jgi:transcriptional regulator with XRE-family HTH domain
MSNAVSVAALIARIRAWRVQSNIAPSRFAEEAGVSESSLRGIDQPGWNPTVRTLEKLEAQIPADWHPATPAPLDGQSANSAALKAA